MDGGRNRKKESLGSSICNLVIQSILGYYFYVYAFRNPDGSLCYASDGSTQVYGSGYKSGSMTDVSA